MYIYVHNVYTCLIYMTNRLESHQVIYVVFPLDSANFIFKRSFTQKLQFRGSGGHCVELSFLVAFV